MQLPAKTQALRDILTQAAREFMAKPEAAIDAVAERAYDAGFAAASVEAKAAEARARQTIELHLNEVAKRDGRIAVLELELERARRR